MKSFLASPFDQIRFNQDYCRAMLMALVVHVFHKDWGIGGSISVLSICAAYAAFQGYMRFKVTSENTASAKKTHG